jgi:glycosyltransferase involved in cell wall biosynthesis
MSKREIGISRPQIVIILPALNEEETIGKVIDEIPKQALKEAGYSVQVLVVDNNSTDRTGQIARQNGATVIVEPEKGKANAVRTGLKSVDADIIFMLDTDYTYPAAQIPEMLSLLNHHNAVIGSRLKGKREKGVMSRLNFIGNYLLGLIATALYQRRISDVCTGHWGFRGEVVKDLNLKATGFDLEAEFFSQLARRGYSIAELPIYYRRRSSPPKLRSLRDGTRIGWALITRRFTGLTHGGDANV